MSIFLLQFNTIMPQNNKSKKKRLSKFSSSIKKIGGPTTSLILTQTKTMIASKRPCANATPPVNNRRGGY